MFPLLINPTDLTESKLCLKSATKLPLGLGFVDIMSIRLCSREMSQQGQVSLGFGTVLLYNVLFRTLYSTGS